MLILEMGKILSDFFKQMITLDTGMIVIIITIVEKILTPERFFNKKNLFITVLSLIAASLICFISSLWFSLRALLIISNRLAAMLKGSATDSLVDSLSFYGSIYSFLAGVVIFFALAIISLYFGSLLGTGQKQVYKFRRISKRR